MFRTIYLFSATLGMGCPVFLDSLFHYKLIIGVVALAIFFWAVRWSRVLTFFLLGFLWGHHQLSGAVARQLPEPLEGKEIELLVTIKGLPEGREKSTRFDALVLEAGDIPFAEQLIGSRARLSWWYGESVRAGQVWRFTVKLRRPRGLANPKGFDYHAWLLHQKIYASGYIKTAKPIHPDNGCSPSWDDRVSVLRLKVAQFFNLHSDQHASLYRALAIGDKSGIDASVWDALNQTGTVHLMAISGLHVGLIAGLCFGFGRGMASVLSFVRSSASLRILPAVVSILGALAYATAAGFSIPTQRALIIVVLLNLAYTLNRKVSNGYLLLLAAFLVVGADPFAFLQAGFWLSFAAVSILLFCFSYRIEVQSYLSALIGAQLVLFIGMAIPLTVVGAVASWASPLANLVAVPVMSVVIIPLTLFAAVFSFVSPYLAAVLTGLLDMFMSGIMGYLEWVASLPLGKLPQAYLPMFSSGAGIVGLMLIFSPAALKLRMLGAISLLAFSSQYFWKDSTPMRFTVLDVGQGLASVLKVPGHTMVYDVGAKFSPTFDTGKIIVAPFLNSHQVNAVDRVVISHGDNDHAGGLEGLSQMLDIKEVVGESSLTDIKNEPCTAGEVWRASNNLEIETVWPDVNLNTESFKHNRNNHSCVLLIRFNKYQIVLLGDVEKDVERILLSQLRMPAKVDIVVAAHHGSKTSSSIELVKHLNADHVIFSAGYKNRYGHPAQKVVSRFKNQGAKIWNTALDGAITVEVGNDGLLKVSAERIKNPKPWY